MIETVSRMGLRVYKERTLPSGAPSKLFVITREEAMSRGPTWPGSAMISPPPRFGFTRAEQQLLEFALLCRLLRPRAATALNLSTKGDQEKMALDLQESLAD